MVGPPATPNPALDQLYRTILDTIHEIAPNTPLAQALVAADAVYARSPAVLSPFPATIASHSELVAYAKTVPAVMDYLRDSKKINAIKELRAAVNDNFPASVAAAWGGLKQCKDAIEDIRL